MKIKCPNCGLIHETEATFESSQHNWLKNAGAMVAPGPAPARPAAPPGLPNFESHVQVPRSQAATTGFFAGAVGGLLFYGAAFVVDASSPNFQLTGWGLFAIGVFGGGLVGFVATWWEWKHQLNKYDGLLYQVESWTGWDLDGDGVIGEPARVEVELRRGGLPWKFESLEISQDRLIKLARSLAGGQSFSERTAADCGIPREEFNNLRNKFVSRGLAEWKGSSPTQGVRLTEDGLDTIAEIATTPLPRASRGVAQNRGYSTHPPKPTHGLYNR